MTMLSRSMTSTIRRARASGRGGAPGRCRPRPRRPATAPAPSSPSSETRLTARCAREPFAESARRLDRRQERPDDRRHQPLSHRSPRDRRARSAPAGSRDRPARGGMPSSRTRSRWRSAPAPGRAGSATAGGGGGRGSRIGCLRRRGCVPSATSRRLMPWLTSMSPSTTGNPTGRSMRNTPAANEAPDRERHQHLHRHSSIASRMRSVIPVTTR